MIKPDLDLDLVGSVEASSMLGVPRVTFNRWAASGKINTAIQTSGKTGSRLFNRADIEQFALTRRLQRSKLSKVKGHHRGRPGQGQTSIPVDVEVDDPSTVAKTA